MPTRRDLLVTTAGAAVAVALPSVAIGSKRGGGPLVVVTADRESHVVMLDASTGRVLERVRTLPGPRSVEAVLGTFALIAHTASGLLTILDAFEPGRATVVNGMKAPRYTAAHGPTAFVTDSTAHEVVTLDVISARIAARTGVPGPARHVGISPDGARLWTALGSKATAIAELAVDDRGRARLRRTLTPPASAHDLVFAPDGRHVWVTSGSDRRIWVYEANGRRPVAELEADEAPQHIAWVAGRAFIASGDSGTMRIHRADGTLIDVVAIPVGSYNVTFGRQRAATPSLERGTVALLDARGRVRSVQRVARAAHDACVVVGS